MAEIFDLTEAEQSALSAALDAGYRAHAAYAQAIRDFGPAGPIIEVLEAEGRHIKALLTLFAGYGIVPPEDRWKAAPPRFGSFAEACVAALQTDIDNADLYAHLLDRQRSALQQES